MNTNKQLLYRILSNFEGMNKLDAFDLLQKMEVLLFYAESPLKKQQIQEIIVSDIDTENTINPFQFTILPNGNFCEYLGANDWIHIYKETRSGLGRFSPFPRYYFKTKYTPLELRKLTNNNLLESTADTAHEQFVFSFLNTHKITAKDHGTGELLLAKDYISL